MTKDQIRNTPELVDYLLDEAIHPDERAKLRKRLNEVCRMALKALEQEPITKNDLVPRNVVERIIKSPRTKEQMLLVLNSLPSQEPITPINICPHCGEYIGAESEEI